MKISRYFLYIIGCVLFGCAPTYTLQLHEEKVIGVQAENDSSIMAIIYPYQEAIKSELSSVIKQEELIPVFQKIMEIEHLPTDEDVNQYVEKILSSSIWPGTPKLVRQIVQELQTNYQV